MADIYYKNYVITPSVDGSGNLTVALKTMAAGDPSASDPIPFKIGDSWYEVSAALSLTVSAGANTFNAGSSEIATNAVKLFTFVRYNSTDGVCLGVARIPYGLAYSDFSATSTNEKYAKWSDITSAAAGDVCANIGCFDATLSAGAGYTWSSPGSVVNVPTYESGWKTWTPTLVGFSANPGTNVYRYRIDRNNVTVRARQVATGTSDTTGFTMTAPFTALTLTNASWQAAGMYARDNGSALSSPCLVTLASNSATITLYKDSAATAWTAANGKAVGYFELNYPIA